MTHESTLKQFRALFELAGFENKIDWPLHNQYWGAGAFDSPWLLVQTQHGLIRIGWRKRVIEINWTATGYHALDPITADDVTKDQHYVHAWGIPKALEYLTALRECMERERNKAVALKQVVSSV